MFFFLRFPYTISPTLYIVLTNLYLWYFETEQLFPLKFSALVNLEIDAKLFFLYVQECYKFDDFSCI